MTSMETKQAEPSDARPHEKSKPSRVIWRPKWFVDVGHGDKVGLTIDDGCFVVLYPREPGEWTPGSHIPRAAADRMAELLNQGVKLD